MPPDVHLFRLGTEINLGLTRINIMTPQGYRMVPLLISVMMLHVATLSKVAGNVILTSNVEEDGRQFACEGEMVTFTCQVVRSGSLQWRSPLIRQIGFTTDPADPVSVPRPPFVATLTNITGSGGNTNFMSTLQVTASRMFARSNTTVECRNLLGVTEQSRFTVADEPAAPLNVTVNQVERVSGGGSVNITANWIRPPNFELFDIDRYDINVSSTSGIQQMAITVNGGSTSAMFTVAENPSNVRPSTTFTITISARNRCGENGPTATASYTLIDCGLPGNPQNGSVASSNGTTEGSEVFYSCNTGLVPEGTMRAVCTGNGWSPNPADLSCTVVNCGIPLAPGNGSIVAVPSTLGGAEIFFRCDTGFVPTGRMRAVCMSDGISPNGTWTPNPATLVCNASIVRCRDPPTLASGVTVQAYNSTAVNSDIFFQCQQPDLVPLYRSATCGSDGRWSPDPSRVECRMITPMPTETPTLTDTPTSTVPTGTPVPTGLSTGVIAAIAIVVLVIIVLVVAIVIVGIVWWRRKSGDVSSKPKSQRDDVVTYSEVADSDKTAPYHNYGQSTEADYTTIPDIPGKSKGPSNGVGYSNITGGPAQAKSAEAPYDLPVGSDHPQGLVYAQVDLKPKKRAARPHDPNPPKQEEEPRVEYASIAYQPKDAAEKSQQAAQKSQEAADRAQKKTKKKHPDADQLLNLDNLLIQLQSLNAMWYQLGVALDLPDSILDDIKDQCRANPEQCMVEMVDAWMTRQMHVGKPTWTDLATGLRKINQTKLADALENIYNTGVLPITVNMTEIPESLFPADSGAPPPIPTRGTLTEDAETPPPKPPKSWGSPPATKTEPSVPPWPHRAQ